MNTIFFAETTGSFPNGMSHVVAYLTSPSPSDWNNFRNTHFLNFPPPDSAWRSHSLLVRLLSDTWRHQRTLPFLAEVTARYLPFFEGLHDSTKPSPELVAKKLVSRHQLLPSPDPRVQELNLFIQRLAS